MTLDKKILLVGCGKMGPAMLSGWIAQGINPENVITIDPVAEETFGITPLRSDEEIPDNFKPDFVVFAVKPVVMKDVCPNYKRFKNEETVFLSIAAGITTESLTEYLGDDAIIVRAMPNIPSLISEGVTVAVDSGKISKQQKESCTNLLESIGKVYWTENEELMDSVTAISGSGPAYVFHFIECLTEAAIELGISEELAKSLALHTVYGSAKLAEKSGESPSSLREKVTSSGGTTEAALEVLMAENRLKTLVINAAKAAEMRSKELK